MNIRLLTLCAFLFTACNGEVATQFNGPEADADHQDVSDMDTLLDMASNPDAADATDLSDLVEDVTADAKIDLPNTSWKSAGCTSGEGLAEGEHTFELEGRSRRYIVRLPQNYSQDKAWPIVFALHGNGGSTSYWDVTTGNRNIRDVLKDDAVLIIAEAIEGNWRDYNAPQDTWAARLESELLYFDTILAEAKNELCIDTDAVFTMGFSGGGSFSGVLTCRRTDYRAMAVGGSVIYFDRDECINTPPAWITIGTLELVAGREQFRDFFRDKAGCEATSQPVSPDPCIAYDGCDANTPVHYCQHAGDHVWPDIGSPAMWDFFKRFLR